MFNQSLCSISLNSTRVFSKEGESLFLGRLASDTLLLRERGQGIRNYCTLQNQWGASLIEVLVAVLVLSIGLLGMAALQTRALKGIEDSLERSQATMLSYFMLDAIEISSDPTAYKLDKTCDVVSEDGTLVKHDQHYWLDAIKKELGPNACGEIKCQNRECSAIVYWSD